MEAGAAKVRTCFWFHTGGREAAEFYVSLLPDSRIEDFTEFEGEDGVSIVAFTLAGTPYQIMTAGPHETLTPAASISVLTDDQAETDRLWSALLGGGGKELFCGWLTDRFGVSWQIVPRRMIEIFAGEDRVRATRARKAMMDMKKIDIVAIEAA